MNKIIIVVVALAVLGGGVFFYFSQEKAVDRDDVKNEVQVEKIDTSTVINSGENGAVLDNSGESTSSGNVVTYTDNGFSPDQIEINAGDVVTFENRSTRDMWPASAIHPTHTVYPGSNIGKCGTSESGNIFDSCGGIAPGGSYSFTFDEIGTWGYHDHLNANQTGKIVVNK